MTPEPAGERRRPAVKVTNILATKGSAVETIAPDATIERAAQRLRTANVGALVVSNDQKHFKGLISERDIVYGLGKHGRALLDMKVRDVMRQSGPTCSSEDTVEHVMRQMTRLRVRHIPVIDRGELRGIVSIGDVVKNRLDETEREVNVLRDIYLARG
jgi:CBS domain-containing protein